MDGGGDPIHASRTVSLSSPGLECLHMTVGHRDRSGMVLVYRSPRDPAVSLPEVAKFISVAMLTSPGLFIAGEFQHPC